MRRETVNQAMDEHKPVEVSANDAITCVGAVSYMTVISLLTKSSDQVWGLGCVEG